MAKKKAAPKKKAAGEPKARDRRAPEIYTKEFNAVKTMLPAEHPLKALSSDDFTKLVDDLADVTRDLMALEINIFGSLGDGQLQIFVEDDKGPVRLAHMRGHGSFSGDAEGPGNHSFNDDLRRGPLQ